MPNVSNLWERVQFYCSNHEEPIPMIVMQGSTPFYACPKYMLKDEDHPEGHELNEVACSNRISFESSLSVVSALEKLVAEAGPSADLTHCSFKPSKMSAIECVVLQYDMACIKIGILNRRAVIR